MTRPTPPQVPGLPLLGNLLDFGRDRGTFLRRNYERFGPIFTIRLGRKPAVVLVKPAYHEFFFTETDKILAMDKPYQFLAAMFGKVAFTAGKEAYYEQRPVLFAPFKGGKMAGYVQVMGEEVRAWFEELGEAGEFEIVSTFQTLTQQVAAHALMGRAFRQQLGGEFFRWYEDLVGGLDPVLPPNLPLPKFIRRDRAKRKLRAMLREIIAERRAHPDEYHDFLQSFIDSHFKDGRAVPDELIINMIIALLFAGHETTAGQGAWGVIQLLQHPDYLARVLEEQQTVFGNGRPLDLRALRDLEHLEWALRETERMRPSADLLLRYNEEPYELGGYHVPAGWLSMVSPELSHRLPNVFTEPERYDPLRYAPGRAEDRQHRFALIGFGGGIHKCTGFNFAYNEMKVITTLLLQQYELELRTPDPQVTHGLGAARPEPPVWIRYRRRAQPLSLRLDEGATGGEDAARCPHAHGDLRLAAE